MTRPTDQADATATARIDTGAAPGGSWARGLLSGLAVLAVGLLVAVLATLGTAAMLSGKRVTYTAQAHLVLVSSVQSPAGSSKIATVLASGLPARTAVAVLGSTPVAARAAAVTGRSPSDLAVTATVSASGGIAVAATAVSAADAENKAQAVVDAGTAPVGQVCAPFTLVEIGAPAGTAVAVGTTTSQVLLFVFPAAFLLGCVLAVAGRHAIGQRRARRAHEAV